MTENAIVHHGPTVRERPIIFSGGMVHAILEGRKTQTRRIVRPQPYFVPVREHWQWDGAHGHASWSGDRPQAAALLGLREHCPYGRPGDRLWVRETWRVSSSGRHYPSRWTTVYVEWREQQKVRGRERGRQHRSEWFCTDDEHDALMRRAYGNNRSATWRPSIHMPRWASRITLEVTAVRIERLQDISEEDAIAEGFTPERGAVGQAVRPGPRDWFAKGWRKMHGEESWDANPWVWVVSFRRVEQ